MPDWKKNLDALIASARTEKEAGELLAALLTPSEYEEMARRWQIVRRLILGETQREIACKLGVSVATVTRGARELNYGSGVFQKFFRRFR